MSNYPDNVDPSDPRAPWNQVEPTCENCKQELDADAAEQNHPWNGDDYPGWPGGLCSSCADAEYDKHGCTCDDLTSPCSLACVGAQERMERSIERNIQRSPSSWTGGDSRDEHDPTL